MLWNSVFVPDQWVFCPLFFWYASLVPDHHRFVHFFNVICHLVHWPNTLPVWFIFLIWVFPGLEYRLWRLTILYYYLWYWVYLFYNYSPVSDQCNYVCHIYIYIYLFIFEGGLLPGLSLLWAISEVLFAVPCAHISLPECVVFIKSMITSAIIILGI